MATVCHNVQDWVETQVEQPIQAWENQQQTRCRNESCNWWTLCLNVLFCWLVWVTVLVTRIVLVTIGNWVTRAVCEVVSFLLDVAAFVVELVLSIPIIGGIIRTILNWATEILWRAVGLIDLALGAFGVRPRKKMYVGLLIPSMNGAPITTEAVMLPAIQRAQQLYLALCNVEIVYTGACTGGDAPSDALTVSCDGGGFFADWWLSGSYFQVSTATCKFADGWRRVFGYGGQIMVVAVQNVLPDTSASSTVGCSFASTHDHVVVEPGTNVAVAAHEIGHACWLGHVSDPTNLMFPSTLSATPTLTASQVALVRWSKHCVYF
jgi:hypothetical protein